MNITTCYLPTAKRITINVIKVNLVCHSNASSKYTNDHSVFVTPKLFPFILAIFLKRLLRKNTHV